MKQCVFVVCCVLLVLSFVGCDRYVDAWNDGVVAAESYAASVALENDSRISLDLQIVAEGDGFDYYVEPLTSVMYLYRSSSSGSGRGLAMSVMYDSDGSVLTYDRFLELCHLPPRGENK